MEDERYDNGYDDEEIPDPYENEISDESSNYGNKVPDAPDGYEIADAQSPEGWDLLPESFRNMNFDKQGFAEIAHEVGLTRDQASKLWEMYTQRSFDSFRVVYDDIKSKEEAKAAEDQKVKDMIRGKELEQNQGLSEDREYTPEEARCMAERISSDPKGDFHNLTGEHSPEEQARVIALVQRLDLIVAGHETTIEGYYDQHKDDQEERRRSMAGGAGWDGEERSSAFGGRHSYEDGLTDEERHQGEPSPFDNARVGSGEKDTSSGYGDKIEDVE